MGIKNINDCVRAAVADNFQLLHNPNKNAIFDTIDPFWFQYGQLVFNGSDKVQGHFTLQNITLSGSNKAVFEKMSVKMNEKVMKINGHVSVPVIYYDGFYESNLKVEDFVVASAGSMNGTFEDVNGKFTAIGNLIDTNDGLRQLNITSFDIVLVIKNMKFKIDGLSKDEILSNI